MTLLTAVTLMPPYTHSDVQFLVGSLPSSWGSPGAFPALASLELEGCNVQGPLPAEWGSPAALQRLQSLHLTACSITGMLQ